LGSTSAKAAGRTFMTLTPGWSLSRKMLLLKLQCSFPWIEDEPRPENTEQSSDYQPGSAVTLGVRKTPRVPLIRANCFIAASKATF